MLTLPVQAGSPRLDNLLPVAGQRGQTVEVTFYGERLHDVSSAVFHTPGMTAGELINDEKDKARRVKATFTIAPDAKVGEHLVRLVTNTGVTELVSFYVVDRPLIDERADEPTKNGNRFKQTTSLEDPQPIELGSAVLGRTEPEDVDYFAVQLKKGQPFAAEVIGMRLGRGFTDAHLAVIDEQGQVIAECDDTLLHLQDPMVSFLAPRDGRYVVVLRDAGYEGSSNNWYLLKVGEAIAPRLVYPLGGQPGQTLQVRMLGDAGGNFVQDVTLPAQADEDYTVLAQYKGLSALSGLPFRVNDMTNVMEDLAGKNNSIPEAKASDVYTLPVAFNGIIERPGDNDHYRVSLKKDQQVTFRCYARSMGSPLDPVINIFSGSDQKHLQGNDDQGGLDSVLTFKAPADDDYYIRVRDHRSRGGGDFVYRLEATTAKPELSTSITRYDPNRPQDRQAIAVPMGNRTAALVSVQRSEIGGDLSPLIDGLPDGVTFQGLSPSEQGNVMPVVFEAANESALGFRLVDIQASRSTGPDSSAQVLGGFNQVTPLVRGNPNNTEYYSTIIDAIPVAVTEAVPFTVDVIEPKAPLVHGGKQRLQIKVIRNEGYAEDIRLYMLYRPTGLGAPGQVVINKSSTEGVYEIDASTATPTRDWPMVVVANANMPGGPVWASSRLFTVKVEAPFVAGTIDNAKSPQGESVDVVVNLQHPRDWQGEGELKLLGLPANASAQPITIKPGQDKAVFNVSVAANTPRGNHNTLMCELTIQVNGEPVIHRFGQGGRLRVDRPGQDNAQANGEQGN